MTMISIRSTAPFSKGCSFQKHNGQKHNGKFLPRCARVPGVSRRFSILKAQAEDAPRDRGQQDLYDEEVRGKQLEDDRERLASNQGVENPFKGDSTSDSDPYYGLNDSGEGESPQFSGPGSPDGSPSETATQRAQEARGTLQALNEAQGVSTTEWTDLDLAQSYSISTEDEELRGKQRKDRIEAQMYKAGVQNPLDATTSAGDPFYGLQDSQDGEMPRYSGPVVAKKDLPDYEEEDESESAGRRGGYPFGSRSSSAETQPQQQHAVGPTGASTPYGMSSAKGVSSRRGPHDAGEGESGGSEAQEGQAQSESSQPEVNPFGTDVMPTE